MKVGEKKCAHSLLLRLCNLPHLQTFLALCALQIDITPVKCKLMRTRKIHWELVHSFDFKKALACLKKMDFLFLALYGPGSNICINNKKLSM